MSEWWVTQEGRIKVGALTIADVRYVAATPKRVALMASAPQLFELAKYVVNHPNAAAGMGDDPHSQWVEMQNMAKDLISKVTEGK